MYTDPHIDEEIISDDDEALNTPSEEMIDVDRPVPCEFLTGNAGTGKTFQTLRLVEQDPTYAWLTATTGIAAVNLGATTVNSALRYSDTDSLRDLYLTGRLAKALHDIALKKRRLLVEEASMIDARQLDLWYRGCMEVNRFKDVKFPFGLVLVGDFGQLPPVRAPWAFEASCWHRFVDNTTKLTKVWRQDTGPFLDAINAARVGNGGLAAEILTSIGIAWHLSTNQEFDGTTILPRNQQVNRYNSMALDKVRSTMFTVDSRRWGKQRPEWGENQKTHEWGIPPKAELKVGAYVMVLSNHPEFKWVNGDCGHIENYNEKAGTIDVRLLRTGKVENIYRVVRGVEQYTKPEDPYTGDRIAKEDDYGEYIPKRHYRGKVKRYVEGQIEFFPVKLAYASTVHKSQGLSLDVVQIDFRDHFFREPAMLYVALSRCRTWQGLRLVGMREVFQRHCNANRQVRNWL